MKTNLFFILFILFAHCSFSQSGRNGNTYTNFTFYFVDNSEGDDSNQLNNEMVGSLEDNLARLTLRPDNYFLFYGCSGDNFKFSNNLTSFVGSSQLKKYLGAPSLESDYYFDKYTIRDYLSENEIYSKQNIEINLYLSAYAVKRMRKSVEELPTPLMFINELPMYITKEDKSNVSIKVNIYINKEALEIVGEGSSKEEKERSGETRIRELFFFCNDVLNQKNMQSEFFFL